MTKHDVSLPLSLAAVVLLGLALAWPGTAEQQPRPETVSCATATPTNAPTSSADAAPPAALVAPPAAPALAALLRYPDGSTRAPLNGVTAALEPSFTDCVPFAPIVGIERDYHGLDWYVHENGVRSTSFRDGRGLPFAAAYMPGAPRPVID